MGFFEHEEGLKTFSCKTNSLMLQAQALGSVLDRILSKRMNGSPNDAVLAKTSL